jgi:NADH:ubiquinone oxidoreductase subunit
MPMDEYRNSYALPPEDKKWLLESAEAFRTTVQAARAWESQAKQADTKQPAQWQPVAAGQRKESSQ